jgi:glucokinase
MNLKYSHDERVVLTLDAGGTNLVFNAMRSNTPLLEDFRISTKPDVLEDCLGDIVRGFKHTASQCKPSAISFAFPGPADYANGVIGGYLPNFPAFREGIALGPYLEKIFGLPVFINNDGDLFAYGEAIAGALPFVNNLAQNKQYKNLIAITLGTGIGGGIVIDGQLLTGDNNAGGEIWTMPNKFYSHTFCEETVSARGLKRMYSVFSDDNSPLEPKDIFEIADSKKPGDKNAALKTFDEFGAVLGDVIANLLTTIDGIVVIGGGISHAYKFFMPKVMSIVNGQNFNIDKTAKAPRLESTVYDLDDEESAKKFYSKDDGIAVIPFSDITVNYNKHKKTAILKSKLGATKAISVGAYAFALNKLDKEKK